MRKSMAYAFLAVVAVVSACAIHPRIAPETPSPNAPTAAKEPARQVAIDPEKEPAPQIADAGVAQPVSADSAAKAGATPPSAASGGGAVQTAAEQRESLKKTLLLLPLRNASSYKGPWDIYTRLPRALADSLHSAKYIRTIPVDSGFVRLNEKELTGEIPVGRAIDLGRELEADVVVLGEIQVLSMSRMKAVVPIGGYRSYRAGLEVELYFYNVIDGTSLGEFLGVGDIASKRTGVTNPAAYLPLEREYSLLGFSPAAWGSQDFAESLVGQAVAMCLHDLTTGVTESALPPPELIALEPKIIDITGAQAYINVGVANGVRNGDKYGVWNRGRELSDPDTGIVLGFSLPARVGVVQVELVLNDRLSQVRILQGEGVIEKGFSIRAE
jgi:hypothetical protein